MVAIILIAETVYRKAGEVVVQWLFACFLLGFTAFVRRLHKWRKAKAFARIEDDMLRYDDKWDWLLADTADVDAALARIALCANKCNEVFLSRNHGETLTTEPEKVLGRVCDSSKAAHVKKPRQISVVDGPFPD